MARFTMIYMGASGSLSEVQIEDEGKINPKTGERLAVCHWGDMSRPMSLDVLKERTFGEWKDVLEDADFSVSEELGVSDEDESEPDEETIESE